MFDPEPIRQILMAYPVYGDRGEAGRVASLFASDGVLEASGRRATGPDAIQAWLSDPAGAAGARRPLFVRHHVTSSLIDLQADGTAKAKTYLLVMTDLGVDHSGVYVDRFQMTDDGWKIAHRKVQIDWVRSDSTYYERLSQTIPDRFRPRL